MANQNMQVSFLKENRRNNKSFEGAKDTILQHFGAQCEVSIVFVPTDINSPLSFAEVTERSLIYKFLPKIVYLFVN